MYFYAEEGGTPTPYMGAHCRHLANTNSHLNYLLPRRCGLMSNYFDPLFALRIPHSACSLDVTLHYYKVIRGAAAPFGRCVIAQLRVN